MARKKANRNGLPPSGSRPLDSDRDRPKGRPLKPCRWPACKGRATAPAPRGHGLPFYAGPRSGGWSWCRSLFYLSQKCILRGGSGRSRKVPLRIQHMI